MTSRPPKEVLDLDMPFGEAMEQFIAVDPKEMHANIARSKKKKAARRQEDRTQHQDESEKCRFVTRP